MPIGCRKRSPGPAGRRPSASRGITRKPSTTPWRRWSSRDLPRWPPAWSVRPMRVELGTPVFCEDKPLGELADVVIDPDKRRLTHLVVQPHGEALVGPRLVPIELTRSGEASEVIALRCTKEDFGRLEPVRELAYERLGSLPVDDPDWDVGIADVLTPAFGAPGELGSMGYPPVTMTYDRIPKDDVELRRSSRVQSSDGHDF